MKRILLVSLAIAPLLVLAAVFAALPRRQVVAPVNDALGRSDALSRAAGAEEQRADDRSAIGKDPRSDDAALRALQEHTPARPTTAEELEDFVAWMSGLQRAELLALTNAEFDFKKSELVEMLQGLEGEWVVPTLARLASGATDDLVKATLVTGLFGGVSFARQKDPRYLEAIESLLPQLVAKELDPFQVGRYVVTSAFMASMRQGKDLAALLAPHLKVSDNPLLLIQGYDMLGAAGGNERLLAQELTAHASAEGRMGALEGLRNAGQRGRVTPEEVTRLGLEALGSETSERNRLLLIELVGSTGGQAGIEALEGLVRESAPGLLGPAVAMIALKGDPAHAQEFVEETLARKGLSEDDRGALYQALGALPGAASGERLLEVAQNAALSDVERLQGLQGLWNRPVDDKLGRELSAIVTGDASGAMRAESLRMLAFNGEKLPFEARELAANDKDPLVRQEAVVLAAMEKDADTRGWLEERLLNDRSPDVKAAALGALVVQARYKGDDGRVLDHLARVKQATSDPQLLKLVERGEQMVHEYDGRRIDLELARQQSFYSTISKYTQGPTRQHMERQAQYYAKMIAALKE